MIVTNRTQLSTSVLNFFISCYKDFFHGIKIICVMDQFAITGGHVVIAIKWYPVQKSQRLVSFFLTSFSLHCNVSKTNMDRFTSPIFAGISPVINFSVKTHVFTMIRS